MSKRFASNNSSSSSDSDTEGGQCADPLANTADYVDEQLLAKAASFSSRHSNNASMSSQPHHQDPNATSIEKGWGGGKDSKSSNKSATTSVHGSPQQQQAQAHNKNSSPRLQASSKSPTSSPRVQGVTPRSARSDDSHHTKAEMGSGSGTPGSQTARSVAESTTSAATTAAATNAAAQQAQEQSQLPPSESTKHCIEMEYGDEYTGEAKVVESSGHLVPHGRGTLQSSSGHHCYVGDFNMRMRDGYGKLVTEKFVLWSKWKGNRPDLSTSARIDYTNGDKYAGYLSIFQDPAAMQLLMRTQTTSLSKFSIWVRASSFLKERWGEIVHTDGSRYFGQWERNMQNGFGCYISAQGDRYIGMFQDGQFEGSGVLFCSGHPASNNSYGASFSTDIHSKQSGGRHSASQQRSQSRNRAASFSPQPNGPNAFVPAVGGGAVYDGQWKENGFVCEEGYLIFPCKTRVTADWTSATQATNADVSYPSKSTTKPWIETFQWEALLCGGNEAARRNDFIDALPTRNALYTAKSKEECAKVMEKLIKENASITNSVKIFRRCFYFLYGTCGSNSEIGGGLGNNKLGWCYVRNAFGGCIHRGHGKVIDREDINNALGDIVSFVHSVRRWVEELVAEKGVNILYQYEMDNFVTRQVLDVVLHDVHPPLFNLYVQVFGKQQVALSAIIEQLNDLTMDDLGVQFGRHESEEKMFDPYADAIHSIQTITKTTSLGEKLAALRTWSSDIDTSTRMAQMKLQDEHLSAVRQVAKKRGMGGQEMSEASFASTAGTRRGSTPPPNSNEFRAASVSSNDARGGAPGEEVNHSIAHESPPTMFSFREELPPSAYALEEDGSSVSPKAVEHVTSSKRILAEAVKVESGSADDLLPIHQYVLIRAAVPYIVAQTQLLVDLSADDCFVDSTSQDAFCITTLHACVSILPQLDSQLKDAKGIVAPVSVLEKRFEDCIQSLTLDGPGVTLSRLTRWIPIMLDAVALETCPSIAVEPIENDAAEAVEEPTKSTKKKKPAPPPNGIKILSNSSPASEETASPLESENWFEVTSCHEDIQAATNRFVTVASEPMPDYTNNEKRKFTARFNMLQELHFAAGLLDTLNIELYVGAAPNRLARVIPDGVQPQNPLLSRSGNVQPVAYSVDPHLAMSPLVEETDAGAASSSSPVLAVHMRKPIPPNIMSALASHLASLN